MVSRRRGCDRGRIPFSVWLPCIGWSSCWGSPISTTVFAAATASVGEGHLGRFIDEEDVEGASDASVRRRCPRRGGAAADLHGLAQRRQQILVPPRPNQTAVRVLGSAAFGKRAPPAPLSSRLDHLIDEMADHLVAVRRDAHGLAAP